MRASAVFFFAVLFALFAYDAIVRADCALGQAKACKIIADHWAAKP